MARDLLLAWKHAFTTPTDSDVAAVEFDEAAQSYLSWMQSKAVDFHYVVYGYERTVICVNLSGLLRYDTLKSVLVHGMYRVDKTASTKRVEYIQPGEYNTDEFDDVGVQALSETDRSIMALCVEAYVKRWNLAWKIFLTTPSMFSGIEVSLGLTTNWPNTFPWLTESMEKLRTLSESPWTRFWDITLPQDLVRRHFASSFRDKFECTVGVSKSTALILTSTAVYRAGLSHERRVEIRSYADQASAAVFRKVMKHIQGEERTQFFTRNMEYLASSRVPADIADEAREAITIAIRACTKRPKTVAFSAAEFDPRADMSQVNWACFATKFFAETTPKDITPLDILTAQMCPDESQLGFITKYADESTDYDFQFTLADVSKKFATWGHVTVATSFDLVLLACADRYPTVAIDGLGIVLSPSRVERYRAFLFPPERPQTDMVTFEATTGCLEFPRGEDVTGAIRPLDRVVFNVDTGRFEYPGGRTASNTALARRMLIVTGER